MSTRATLALGAIFASLLAAYLLTGQRERRIERAEFETTTLFEFSPADITTLSIQQTGAEPVEAVRKADGGWEFAGAYRHIPPNEALWDQLAQVMTVARNERPIPGGEENLASFELDPPQLTVVVGTKQGVAHQIDFGGLDPTQRHRYHRMASAGIFLSNADWFAIMNRTLGELRDRRLFHNLSNGLAKFEYQRYLVSPEGAEEVSGEVRQRMAGIDESYAKNDDGQWRLVRPVDAPARPDALEVLERVLPSLGGRAFIDAPENLADYGLDQPFARMTVYGPEGNDGETLLLGGIDSADTSSGEAGLYVKHEDGDAVIVVDARLFTLLPTQPEAFRERRLFTREAAGLTRLSYRDGTHAFLLENGEGGWALAGAPGGETDQVAVSMYIAQLKRAEGTSFPASVSAEAFGAARIELQCEFEGNETSTIEIGAPLPGSDPISFFARTDFGSTTTISFESFQALQATPFNFLKKTLMEFDPKAVSGIELTLEGTQYTFERENDRWSVTQPAGSQLGAQAEVNNFLTQLSATQAKGVADPPPAAEVQGVETPILEVMLRLQEANVPAVGPLRVGNLKTAASRERFAIVPGRSGVYFVDQGLVDVARECVARVRTAQ